MSVFEKHRDTLEQHETMMGPARGRLAVALVLEQLNDAKQLVQSAMAEINAKR